MIELDEFHKDISISFNRRKIWKVDTLQFEVYSCRQYIPGLGKTEFLSVPDQNSEIGTDWKQPKAQKNRSHTGPILRKFSPILSDI